MPGLIRGVARTAVVAGTATAVSNRVSRRQAYRWAEQDRPEYAEPQAYAEAPSSSRTGGMLAQLQELGQLKASGVLTFEEFEAQKAKILSA
jgi:hypothetical protein